MSAGIPVGTPAGKASRVVALAVFGGLSGQHLASSAGVIVASALVAVVGGGMVIAVMQHLLSAGNARLRADHGEAAVDRAVANGFVMLLPYAVLALLAELLFHWEAVQACMASGLMTAAALAASELSALGGRPIYNTVLPALFMTALSAAWMVLSTLAIAWLPS